MGMKTSLSRIVTVGALALTSAAAFADAPLKAHPPVMVPGGPGGFDWMLVDGARNRLYATHGGAKKLTVLDLKTGAMRQIDAGAVSGVAVDAPDGKVFTGGADQKVVILDDKTLARTGEVVVTGPVDDIKYDPKNGLVYADHDDGTEVWVIDARAEKIVGTIAVAGAPEALAYDAGTDRIYQNIKPADCVQVIDPAINKIVARWDTKPATSPHGLVVDPVQGRLFSAGTNGKLVVLDLKTGRLVTSVTIAAGVDQIAFDSRSRRIYCACRGFVSVVQETADGGAQALGDVAAPKGAHTLAVDSRTGDVWESYANATGSYLQRFTAN